ncbi:MAG: DsbC family protein [Gammaproteobacteria bacterium]|nr:DsbC family protein [Gammaproteobacteria bacterium]
MSSLKRIAVLWFCLISAAFAADDYPVIRKALDTVLPGSVPDKIQPAPVPGLYEVTFGPQLFYISEDGKYLVQGHVLDIAGRKDLTEARQGELRKASIDAIGEDNMLIFAAAKPKHTVTVFTDVDCGYCRKLHNEIKQTNALGITVRYLFFPRSGPNTESYYKAVSVWCSENRQQALTDAKAGKELPKKTCANPIDKHMELVHAFGLQGTPAIILEDGRMVPGYMPAKQIQAALEGKMEP